MTDEKVIASIKVTIVSAYEVNGEGDIDKLPFIKLLGFWNKPEALKVIRKTLCKKEEQKIIIGKCDKVWLSLLDTNLNDNYNLFAIIDSLLSCDKTTDSIWITDDVRGGEKYES